MHRGPVVGAPIESRAECAAAVLVFVAGLGAAVAWQASAWAHTWSQFTLGPGKSGIVSSWCLLAIPVDLVAIWLWWRWARRSVGRSLVLAVLIAPVWFASVFFALFVIGPVRVLLWHIIVGDG